MPRSLRKIGHFRANFPVCALPIAFKTLSVDAISPNISRIRAAALQTVVGKPRRRVPKLCGVERWRAARSIDPKCRCFLGSTAAPPVSRPSTNLLDSLPPPRPMPVVGTRRRGFPTSSSSSVCEICRLDGNTADHTDGGHPLRPRRWILIVTLNRRNPPVVIGRR